MIGPSERQAKRRGNSCARVWAYAGASALLMAACDPSPPEPSPAHDASSNAGEPAVAVIAAPAPADPVSPPTASTPSPTARAQVTTRVDPRGARTALERATLAQQGNATPPSEIRRANRATMIYADAKFGSPFRGKLTHGEDFGVFERVEASSGDRECRGEGWARIGVSAFICLEHTSPSKRVPRELPVLGRGQLTPHYYARVRRKNAAGEVPLAPRWASRSALAAGAEPLDHLQPDHDYAFERRRSSRNGTVLVDKAFRVVREADVRRLEPSGFAGRDVVVEPLPDEGRLAWSLEWPHALIRAEPNLDAKIVGKAVHQSDFFVTDTAVRRRGVEWIAVAGERPGWIAADEIRRWYPAPRPDKLGDEELWIDVELEQQTLAVMLGDAPLFVTMIASGNHKHPTPQGVFRIKTKMATSTMDSQAGDEEAYSVEGVPWAQFFHKRYGLHGTFWHNRFGRRTSHGCVNLSAKDAALVYAMTAPDPLPGWAMAFAHDNAPGTVIRVRKMDAVVRDRRAVADAELNAEPEPEPEPDPVSARD